jgi:hypothetical protein
MPPGRRSQFNDAQEAILKGYIPAFEARVKELDPGLKGNNSLLSAWKAATTNEILGKPEFKEFDGELKKWRLVSSSARACLLSLPTDVMI